MYIRYRNSVKCIFCSYASLKCEFDYLLGPPDPPRNCSLSNQTQESLQVDCVEGFSSGLTQEFHMEVFSGLNHQLLVNITARSPKLLARGLPPGRSLFLRVYASNTKGRSRSVTFDAYTLEMADKHPGRIEQM